MRPGWMENFCLTVVLALQVYCVTELVASVRPFEVEFHDFAGGFCVLSENGLGQFLVFVDNLVGPDVLRAAGDVAEDQRVQRALRERDTLS